MTILSLPRLVRSSLLLFSSFFFLTSFFTLRLSLSQKRLAKEARDLEIQLKNPVSSKKPKEPTAKPVRGRGEASFYRVTCKVLFALLIFSLSPSLLPLIPFFLPCRIMEKECHMMIYLICLGEVSCILNCVAFP